MNAQNSPSAEKRSIEQANALTCLIALAITGYGIWAFWGPYRWIAQLQVAIFGAYEMKITFLLSLIVCLLALLPIQYTFSRIQSKVEKSEKPPSKTWQGFESFVNTRAGHLILAGLGCFGFALYSYIVAYSLGEQVTVDLAAIETQSSPLPDSRWWKLEGVLVPEEGQSWEENHSKRYYMPLISRSWKTGDPIAVVARIDQYAYKKLSSRGGVFQGTAHPSGLPGDVFSYWEKNSSGNLKIPEGVLLFDIGDGPEERQRMGFVFLCLGLGASTLGGIAHWLSTRKKKGREPEQERFRSAHPN